MRPLTLALAAIFAVLWATAAQAQAAEAGQVIPGQYIVAVESGHDPKGVAANQDADTTHVYRGVLNGFAAKLDREQLRALRRSGKVARIEADRVVTASVTQNMDSTGQPWGLDRIDQRALPLSRTYTYNSTGSNVYAYIIDTGIRTTHSNFGGRAQNVYDAFGGNGQDCNGHGTHVAGTVGGATYGVAKAARLRGLRVLNCSGSGSTSGIIAALNWLRLNAQRPAVANMSLGGGYSPSLNTATTNLSNAGVFVAVAAGNENQNACNVSPASTPAAYTTAASNSTDTRASWSNYGSCVDGYAPGVSIKSAWHNGGTNTISGTSMASPHVAGVGALYKATYGDASSATISSWINNNATANVIRSNRTGTPNRLLFKNTL